MTRRSIVLLVVLLILFLFRRRPASGVKSGIGGVSARVGHHETDAAGAVRLPQWTWLVVDPETAGRRGLLPGRYAGGVFDQHRSGWCGCCYLIAVVQMIEDRWNIIVGRNMRKEEGDRVQMHPYVRLDKQRMLDEYDAVRRVAAIGWNACKGGDPRMVIGCIRGGSCPLRLEPPDGSVWVGHPRDEKTPTDPIADRVAVKVGSCTTIPNEVDAVKRVIYDRGTVVLGIDAQCLIHADEKGVADRSSRVSRNHAVTVVGWTTLDDGEECWVVRNSWGKHSVPTSLPDDTGCVSRDGNECAWPTRAWSGTPILPGFVLVPTAYIDHEAVSDGSSPWWEARVVEEALAVDDGMW